VTTLESTIQQAALAAQRAARDAAEKVTIEVSVANGYKGGTNIPIPVVPIDVESSLTQTTKLTIDVDLKKYTPPSVHITKGVAEPTYYVLDLETGLLEEKAK